MGFRPVHLCFIVFFVITCISCTSKPSIDPKIEALVAQKLMLDIRYFCEKSELDVTTQRCTAPVTRLPDDLKEICQ